MGTVLRRNSSIFQSTLPQGERLFGIYSRQRYCFISIHAPARGATEYTWIRCMGQEFQSTLPQGERRIACLCMSCLCYFNPRSRKGSDMNPAALTAIH